MVIRTDGLDFSKEFGNLNILQRVSTLFTHSWRDVLIAFFWKYIYLGYFIKH